MIEVVFKGHISRNFTELWMQWSINWVWGPANSHLIICRLLTIRSYKMIVMMQNASHQSHKNAIKAGDFTKVCWPNIFLFKKIMFSERLLHNRRVAEFAMFDSFLYILVLSSCISRRICVQLACVYKRPIAQPPLLAKSWIYMILFVQSSSTDLPPLHTPAIIFILTVNYVLNLFRFF